MNDLDLMRTVLDDVPLPSPTRMAAGRARLLAAAAAADPASHRHPGFRRSRRLFFPAGAAAAAIAVAVLVAVSNGGTAPPRTRPASPAQTARHVNLTAKVLAAAAKAAALRPATVPAADQWFYYESVSAWNGKISGGYDHEWITFDGTESAYYAAPYAGAPVQLIVHHAPGSETPTTGPGARALTAWDANAVPLTAYNALASLPTSPSALLAAIDADITASHQSTFGVMGTASTTSQKEFAYLGQLLWNAYAAAPPSALAAVYQAIATIPGVTVKQGLTDAAGSPAVGVSDNSGATELLLNPQTYQVIGINLWSPAPRVAKGPKGPKGEAGTSSIAYLRIAKVSGPGQR